MAGKGDRARHTVNETWRENYERIFAKKPKEHLLPTPAKPLDSKVTKTK